MNKEQLKGKWKQVAGEAKSKWGKLTDDDIARSDGDTQKLAGVLQEAEKQVNSWTESIKD